MIISDRDWRDLMWRHTDYYTLTTLGPPPLTGGRNHIETLIDMREDIEHLWAMHTLFISDHAGCARCKRLFARLQEVKRKMERL